MLSKKFKYVYILQVILLILSSIGYLYLSYNTYSSKTINNNNDIVFLLDISESMNIQDVYTSKQQSISRLQAAKNEIFDSIENKSFENYGIIVFKNTSKILIPPSQDVDYIKKQLKSLHTSSIQGNHKSNIDKAIQKFVQHSQTGSKAIILSDMGNDLEFTSQKESYNADLIDKFHNKNLTLEVIGLGDNLAKNVKETNNEYVYQNGAILKDKLNKEYLNFISKKFQNKPNQSIYQDSNELKIIKYTIKFFSLLGI